MKSEAAHKMGPTRLNHGNAQCEYCHATDLEISFALGPVCPNAPRTDAWVEWDGNAATIPEGMGLVQFSHETREQATLREPSEVSYWPWFGEDEKPCVRAYRLSKVQPS